MKYAFVIYAIKSIIYFLTAYIIPERSTYTLRLRFMICITARGFKFSHRRNSLSQNKNRTHFNVLLLNSFANISGTAIYRSNYRDPAIVQRPLERDLAHASTQIIIQTLDTGRDCYVTAGSAIINSCVSPVVWVVTSPDRWWQWRRARSRGRLFSGWHFRPSARLIVHV